MARNKFSEVTIGHHGKMDRYMLKLEVGGEWHCFFVDATNGHHVAALAIDLGVPLKAHTGIRVARADESHPNLTKADVERLAGIGWTWHGEPLAA